VRWQQVVHFDHHRLVEKIAEKVRISVSRCYIILIEDLKVHNVFQNTIKNADVGTIN
jgi:hypothetical protein